MNRYVILAAALVLACSAPALPAQTPDSACTYLSCALRIEPRGLRASLVRGAQGEVVANTSAWGARPALSTLVARSDSAVAYALRYERLAPRAAGSVLLASSLAFLVPALDGKIGDATAVGLSLTGIAVSVYGTVVGIRAQRALSRSIWWYNAALVP